MPDESVRYIPLGSCTWCGHMPHGTACGSTITTLKDRTLGTLGGTHQAPCPCTRHEAGSR